MKYCLTLALTLFAIFSFTQEKNWTILYYAVGSNSSETDLLSDVAEMKDGKKTEDYNLILLIDRIEGFSDDSTTLDGNFTDTRLYKIENNAYDRLEGNEFFPDIRIHNSFEANMADAKTLKKFIQYGKKYYPAKHYLLVLRSHGNGLSMCSDLESGERDRLYPSEITNILTAHESVDILGLDVCSMAGIENLYQWRPGNNAFSADYVIASAPLSGAWAYDRIFERLTFVQNSDTGIDSNYFDGGKESNLNPNTMNALEFSKLIMEEIYDNQRWASWGLFDNSNVNDLKHKIDEASKSLAEEQKLSILKIIESSLGYHHNTSNNSEIAELTFPYIDAYDFWYQISEYPSFSILTRKKAKEVCKAIDDLVTHSYYGTGYLPEALNFQNGLNGVYLIIPKGDKIFSQSNNSFWSHCGWFHPDDKSSDHDSYGQYDWCSQGAIRENNKVENFYELLDYLFDDKKDTNNYKW